MVLEPLRVQKEDFGFSDDIILEACNRTMEHTHTASFPYADKILLNKLQPVFLCMLMIYDPMKYMFP